MEGKGEGSGKAKFFACYLLCSQNPRSKGTTYIGFTVNPCRRIRQHNGEITNGAWRTKKRRPWEMVLCVHSFPTKNNALQFEWAWQHPTRSIAVREVVAQLKSVRGVKGKIKLVFAMLNLPAWSSLKLTVQFLSTKYLIYKNGCESFSSEQVIVAPIDTLPCYGDSMDDTLDDDDCSESCDDQSEDSDHNTGGSENILKKKEFRAKRYNKDTSRDSRTPGKMRKIQKPSEKTFKELKVSSKTKELHSKVPALSSDEVSGISKISSYTSERGCFGLGQIAENMLLQTESSRAAIRGLMPPKSENIICKEDGVESISFGLSHFGKSSFTENPIAKQNSSSVCCTPVKNEASQCFLMNTIDLVSPDWTEQQVLQRHSPVILITPSTALPFSNIIDLTDSPAE